MGLNELKKQGWFEKSQEIELPELSEAQLKKIKNGEEVIISQNNDSIVIYIKKEADLKNISIDDLVIRKIPYVAKPSADLDL